MANIEGEVTVLSKTDDQITDDNKGAINKKMYEEFEKVRKASSLDKNFVKDMDSIFNDFKAKGLFKEDGSFDESRALKRGNLSDIKKWSQQNSNLILEVADNGGQRVFIRRDRYDDPGQPYVTKDKVPILSGNKIKLETADDDERVLGIPYAQAMAGDRVYIINGKVFTGWSLYFSLSSIKSPEDYARSIDLVYNVPYLHASILLKAQLGLGTGFDVNYGSEDTEVAEEKLMREYLFKKLKINTQKLVKTGFHLYTYGNAYWALRRDDKGLVDKITILQPERLKIFLDPMTTKVLFYIYLPPIIGGTTIASYPSDGRYNPNILTGVTLSYPTPIVIHPEDMMHFKINDFTEYPFGFSDIKTCTDPATARLDINILAPIIFKKYAKPMIHWTLKTEGLGGKQIQTKQSEMITMLEDMEPGSDPVTTDLWSSNVIQVNAGKGDIFQLAADMDTQIFAATGAPETYFKPKGSTDRMISEQDKTFIARLKVPQSIVAEQIEEKLIQPRIDYELKMKRSVAEMMGVTNPTEEFLRETGSWLADSPKYPEVVWNEIFKQDETQAIANAIALTNAGIIDRARASTRIGEKPIAQQDSEDALKVGIDDPIAKDVPTDPMEIFKGMTRGRYPMQAPVPGMMDPNAQLNEETGIPKSAFTNPNKPNVDKREVKNTPKNFNEQENMETLRGGLNIAGRKDDSNRNVNKVKDPSQLGGSRYTQHALKRSETADMAIVKVGDKISLVDGVVVLDNTK